MTDKKHWFIQCFFWLEKMEYFTILSAVKFRFTSYFDARDRQNKNTTFF